MNGALWISETGRIDEASQQLLPVAKAPHLGAIQLASETAFDFGFIGLSGSHNGVTVRLDLAKASNQALECLTGLLERDLRETTLIYKRHGGWIGEGCDSGVAAAERLECLASVGNLHRMDLAVIEERDLDWLTSGNADGFLLDCFRLWEASDGVISDGIDGLERILSRSQLTVQTAEGKAPTFIFVGECSTSALIWGRRWAAAAIGSSSVPDSDYDARVTAAYRAVLETGQPAVHCVTARIKRSDGVQIWVPYQRLILPCRMHDGRPLFNCATAFAPELSAQMLEPAGPDRSGPRVPSKRSSRLH
ncbi:MAG: hypothetical protein MI920_20035 [Kiloniellales bacterium]|nr:hypothetical protein [Kiloniellales bacterium]